LVGEQPGVGLGQFLPALVASEGDQVVEVVEQVGVEALGVRQDGGDPGAG
jgi:hypothetical protein